MTKRLENNATLIGRVDVAPNLAIFRIRPDRPFPPAPGRAGAVFVPGQYVTIGLNCPEDHEGPASVQRPMTIASAPEDPDRIELYIKRVMEPESELPLSHLIFELPIGGRLYVRPVATGRFTIDETIGEHDARTKLMVAAGTGLAPFLSMIRSRARRGARLDDIVLLHGVSVPAQLGFREELESLTRTAGLRYFATISRPEMAPGWDGPTGRVERWLDADRIESLERGLALEVSPDRTVVFVCGLQPTIAAVARQLVSRGFVPDHRRLKKALGLSESHPSSVFFEQYDADPLFDPTDAPLMASLRADLERALGRPRERAAHP